MLDCTAPQAPAPLLVYSDTSCPFLSSGHKVKNSELFSLGGVLAGAPPCLGCFSHPSWPNNVQLMCSSTEPETCSRLGICSAPLTGKQPAWALNVYFSCVLIHCARLKPWLQNARVTELLSVVCPNEMNTRKSHESVLSWAHLYPAMIMLQIS